ncbi:unnamed protein product [Rotaria sp. Silwood1]|nr:unnamed protein product [Rotaria sp. Silwood1]CAF1054961.1 unnamed protein product [Rotaria sp. Silwood1]CAF1260891.1 unnamed protein product [Rotaria sp. Silwood1]CAF3431391.1 unnamed protein product [Rotaria sp. Silwood1]CAF3440595.1 unnamed protein product [Rotaria sp. Silwood1]
MLNFSWEDCGPSSDPIQVTSLTISPDPVEIPGDLTLAVSADITSALPTDIYIALTMERKVDGLYIKVPCIDNVGSCNYGNICEAWAQVCPQYFAKYGIPCDCPIPANTYSIPETTVTITSTLPALLTGTFRITADIRSSEGHLGCIQAQINLKT